MTSTVNSLRSSAYLAPSLRPATVAATMTWDALPGQRLTAVDSAIQAARLGDDGAFAALIDLYRSAAERVAQQILHTEEAAADARRAASI